MIAPLVASLETGVGTENPNTLSLVRRANVGSGETTPSRVIPHFGKVTEDSGKASSHKHW
jgi:hypothetical protein